MKISIAPQKGLSIYYQIVEQIKHYIAVGALKRGEQLPTVRQLAVDLKVNPNTVSRAYFELEREGLIKTRQGIGTFVDKDQTAISLERMNELEQHCRNFVEEMAAEGYNLSDIFVVLKKINAHNVKHRQE